MSSLLQNNKLYFSEVQLYMNVKHMKVKTCYVDLKHRNEFLVVKPSK